MMTICNECDAGDCGSCEGDPCECSHVCKCSQVPIACTCDGWES